MSDPLLGIVRVVTSDDPAFVGAHGAAIRARYQIATTSACIPDAMR
ncbi:hypothetical protein [Actinocatenispora sera]|uniref:Uncharacterized protein n=1 Tax=Actinocatenispora sera TaxID=390989 RepID=A0A810LAB3_9ACTN|nr:hypothetical protein [Actinocatenispora sera]BCJ31532.1 hypothetical protein Asera_56400 [Actinocatenispora sera]